MNTFSRLALLCVCATLAAGASAQAVFGTSHTIKSALKNVDNMWWSRTAYDVRLTKSDADGDLYINSTEVIAGSNWTTDLGFYGDIGTSTLLYGGNALQYQLGTAITGDVDWEFGNLYNRVDAVDANVAPGFYDFEMVFRGGADANATDELFRQTFQVEVVDRLEVDVTGTAAPGVIGWNQSTEVTVTAMNNSASRNYLVSSWFYGNGGMVNGTNSLDGDFIGNWFGTDLAPGQSKTDFHTRWTAKPGTPGGTYSSILGLVGGFYAGDEHLSLVTPPATVEVVPEPATLAVLGLGALTLVRRRRA